MNKVRIFLLKSFSKDFVLLEEFRELVEALNNKKEVIIALEDLVRNELVEKRFMLEHSLNVPTVGLEDDFAYNYYQLLYMYGKFYNYENLEEENDLKKRLVELILNSNILRRIFSKVRRIFPKEFYFELYDMISTFEKDVNEKFYEDVYRDCKEEFQRKVESAINKFNYDRWKFLCRELTLRATEEARKLPRKSRPDMRAIKKYLSYPSEKKFDGVNLTLKAWKDYFRFRGTEKIISGDEENEREIIIALRKEEKITNHIMNMLETYDSRNKLELLVYELCRKELKTPSKVPVCLTNV